MLVVGGLSSCMALSLGRLIGESWVGSWRSGLGRLAIRLDIKFIISAKDLEDFTSSFAP